MRLALTATLSLPLLLTGCALTNTATPGTSTGALLKGNVHGGQQPVVGAHVHLFAAGTSGYGGSSVSLLNANTDGADSLGSYVLTDANGSFSITGDYACTAGSQVYLLATGGNPGLPGNQTNPNLALMTALGQCPASGSFAASIPTVSINEVTSIASVYAISGFMTDLTHVSSSGTPLAQTGIAHAFATTNNLVDITTGTALATTPAGNGVAPQLTINTLANIIATCVNSTGASSTACSTLFSTALNGTTQPTDTVTAALNIAHNPTVGVSTLLALIPAAPPFATTSPFLNHDFMLALRFRGGGIEISTYGYNVQYHDNIAVDGNGNVWKTNPQVGSLSELSNLGVAISPSTGYTPFLMGSSLAIDPSNNVWVSEGGTSAVQLAQLDGTTGLPTGVGVPLSGNMDLFTVDGFGNVWALQAASPTNIVKIDHSTHATTTFSGGGLFSGTALDPNSLWAIVVSGDNNVWVSNPNAVLSEFDGSTGTALSANGYATGQPSPTSMAVDGNGNLWISDFLQSDITNMSSTGNILLVEAIASGGPLNMGPPGAMAVDGSNSIWVVNDLHNWLVRLDANSGVTIPTRASYYQSDPTVSLPTTIAVDGSGNIWAADISEGTGGIIEYVGLATPVVTPMSAAVANHAIGARP